MTLQEYRRKRNFQRTPEPSGEPQPAAGALRFVVQKHAASHLHYDFRLELEGVLKSWAVPKGPSLDPEDKRLAMMVEDHPLDYRTFEGVIPAGNYGAGTVMVWDEGTYYAADADPEDVEATRKLVKGGLHKGHISIVLQGQKLRGEFALAKMKSGEENSWLLVKKGDRWASEDDVTALDRSAVTNRDLEQIAGSGVTWRSNRSLPDVSDLPAGSPPRHIKPMLATLVEKPFDGEGWWFEVKWDGYRAIADVRHGDVELYSRNALSFNEQFSPIVSALRGLGVQAVLDGEVVVLDENGRSSFQLLQGYLKRRSGDLVYYVFDMPYFNGRDLQSLPLSRRFELLKAVLTDSSGQIRISDHVEKRGRDFYDLAASSGLEGIMAKDASSRYVTGKRTRSWLKIKTNMRQEAVIGGYTEPRGSRSLFGSLVLGLFENGKFVYIGHSGGGFTEASLGDVYEQLRPLEQANSPFSPPPKTNAPAHWVEPKLVCEVSFSEWTDEGLMRHPIFLGMRTDKDPRSVTRESPQPPPSGNAEPDPQSIVVKDSAAPASKRRISPKAQPPETAVSPPEKQEPAPTRRPSPKAQQVTIGGHRLRLTHLDKLYWPDDGYTKGDLIDYYRSVAPYLVPHLAGRPESMHRHPNGINAPSFFQKNMEDTEPPAWAETIKIRSEGEGRIVNYLICDEEATLIFMANYGCIELNPWLSRKATLEKPDFCLIDLDPEEIGFDAVLETALAVHELLDAIKAPHYCKTSGATGLHICVPLGAKYSYEQSKQFAEIVARLIHSRLPKITSVERNPAKRQKRVYVDFLQNRRGQTMASVYCVRPRPGATVSTPLEWPEVNAKLNPRDFTIKNIGDRLEKKGDLWKPVIGPGADLNRCLANLAELSG
jgi:bifunctional non-homologous end joining protein LigD